MTRCSDTLSRDPATAKKEVPDDDARSNAALSVEQRSQDLTDSLVRGFDCEQCGPPLATVVFSCAWAWSYRERVHRIVHALSNRVVKRAHTQDADARPGLDQRLVQLWRQSILVTVIGAGLVVEPPFVHTSRTVRDNVLAQLVLQLEQRLSLELAGDLLALDGSLTLGRQLFTLQLPRIAAGISQDGAGKTDNKAERRQQGSNGPGSRLRDRDHARFPFRQIDKSRQGYAVGDG